MSRRYYETATTERRDKEVEKKMFDNMTLWVVVYLLAGLTTTYYLHRRDK